MSSVVSALTGGGGSGVNFQAKAPDLITPVDKKQADEQYANVQQGLSQQQQFLNAVNAQNGLGNQTQVFNQLQGVANGTGPNPAQAMLNQSTGNNIASQNALMAGQRGASANPALIARQAAQVGGNIQQQAAGQGATLQANQSLNALNSMGQLATNQANQQANATNAYSNAAQGAQNQVLGAIQGVNNARVDATSSQNSANAAIQGQVAQGQMNLVGNVLGGVGSALMLAEGGAVDGSTPLTEAPAAKAGPKSKIGQYFSAQPLAGQQIDPISKGGNQFGQGIGTLMKGMLPAAAPAAAASPAMIAAPMASKAAMPMMLANGGKVDALVSPGEGYLPPEKVAKVAKGADPIKESEKIPGKPKVGGAIDSYKNDVVPRTLETGGIVLPRSVMESKHPHWAAHRFVSTIMKEQALKGKKK